MTGFLAFIYNMLMDTGTADSPKFNFFHGQDCVTDTDFAAGLSTKNYSYCALPYTQIWKFVFVSLGVSFWVQMILYSNIVARFVNPFKDQEEETTETTE